MIPMLLCILRASHSFDSVCELTILEDLCWAILSMTLNLKFSDSDWNLATFPVKAGGLGIQIPKEVALPAFLASVSLSHKLKESILHKVPNFEDGHFVTVIELWRITQVEPPSQGIIKQYAWDAPLVRKKLHYLLSSAVSFDADCFSSVSADVGGGLNGSKHY